jgi:hypothetical protein
MKRLLCVFALVIAILTTGVVTAAATKKHGGHHPTTDKTTVVRGRRGPRGPRGLRGATGSQGPAGSAGAAGAKGLIGATGSPGTGFDFTDVTGTTGPSLAAGTYLVTLQFALTDGSSTAASYTCVASAGTLGMGLSGALTTPSFWVPGSAETVDFSTTGMLVISAGSGTVSPTLSCYEDVNALTSATPTSVSWWVTPIG